MRSWRSVTSNLNARISVWLAAFWWVSLTIIGFMVVPMLFASLPTPTMAGGMAAKLFSAQTWVSCLCGLLLLIQAMSNLVLDRPRRAQETTIYIVAGILFALLVEFFVAPKIVARENLQLWHSVGSVMYLLQCMCAAITFWKLTGPSRNLLCPVSHQV